MKLLQFNYFHSDNYLYSVITFYVLNMQMRHCLMLHFGELCGKLQMQKDKVVK